MKIKQAEFKVTSPSPVEFKKLLMSEASTSSSTRRKKIPYPGKNKIFFDGLIVTSPNAAWIFVTFLLLAFPVIHLLFM